MIPESDITQWERELASMNEVERLRERIKQLGEVNKLHRELQALYRAKSNDRRTIAALWVAVEAREAGLILSGVLVP